MRLGLLLSGFLLVAAPGMAAGDDKARGVPGAAPLGDRVVHQDEAGLWHAWALADFREDVELEKALRARQALALASGGSNIMAPCDYVWFD